MFAQVKGVFNLAGQEVTHLLLAIQQMVQEDTGDTKADLTEWKGSRYCDLDTVIAWGKCIYSFLILSLSKVAIQSCHCGKRPKV